MTLLPKESEELPRWPGLVGPFVAGVLYFISRFTDLVFISPLMNQIALVFILSTMVTIIIKVLLQHV